MIKPGDRIRYRNEDTGAIINATVLGIVKYGWLEVADEEGLDTPYIHPSLVVEIDA